LFHSFLSKNCFKRSPAASITHGDFFGKHVFSYFYLRSLLPEATYGTKNVPWHILAPAVLAKSACKHAIFLATRVKKGLL
jgi:hypothetical protein